MKEVLDNINISKKRNIKNTYHTDIAFLNSILYISCLCINFVCRYLDDHFLIFQNNENLEKIKLIILFLSFIFAIGFWIYSIGNIAEAMMKKEKNTNKRYFTFLLNLIPIVIIIYFMFFYQFDSF